MTTAQINLPRDAPPSNPQESGASHSLALDSPFPDQRAPRILLVDDEPINIQVARKFLERAGYREFFSATDAADVLPLKLASPS